MVHNIVDAAREDTSDHVLSCCGCVWVGGVFACPPPLRRHREPKTTRASPR